MLQDNSVGRTGVPQLSAHPSLTHGRAFAVEDQPPTLLPFSSTYSHRYFPTPAPFADNQNSQANPDPRLKELMLFVKESRILATPAQVFAFHESPGALEKLTPPWEAFQVIAGGDSIKPGSRVSIRMSMGPFPVVWIAEHTEYEPPHLFADCQVQGPFTSWYHRHRFLDDGQGGTLMRDEITFQPPLGAIGRVLGGWFLRRKLEKTFSYRHEAVRARFA